MPKQLTSPIRQAFAQKLREIRIHNRPAGKPKLTQALFASALSERYENDEQISEQTVNYWENYRVGIAHDKRDLLTNIIAVFHEYGHITSLQQANELLTTGRYDRLSTQEIMKVNSDWIVDAQYIYDGSAEIHFPSSTNTIGFAKQAADLLQHLTSRDASLHVIYGPSGSGKTKLISLVVHMLRISDASIAIRRLNVAIENAPNPKTEAGFPHPRTLGTAKRNWKFKAPRLHLPNGKSLSGLLYNRPILIIDGLITQADCDYFCSELELMYSGKLLITARHKPTLSTVSAQQITPLDATAATTLLSQRLQHADFQLSDAQITELN